MYLLSHQAPINVKNPMKPNIFCTSTPWPSSPPYFFSITADTTQNTTRVLGVKIILNSLHTHTTLSSSWTRAVKRKCFEEPDQVPVKRPYITAERRPRKSPAKECWSRLSQSIAIRYLSLFMQEVNNQKIRPIIQQSHGHRIIVQLSEANKMNKHDLTKKNG